jgi:Txe/YoeB family toxin of Txe-Axe toxin-antitoxin module
LREFPGFHDEKLNGRRTGEWSSRLSLQYRVIYKVESQSVTVFVLEINPHDY